MRSRVQAEVGGEAIPNPVNIYRLAQGLALEAKSNANKYDSCSHPQGVQSGW